MQFQSAITLLEAVSDLNRLMNQFCSFSDKKDWSGRANCFTSTGTLKMFDAYAKGPEEIAEMDKVMWRKYELLSYHMSNLQFDVAGAKATGTGKLTVVYLSDWKKPAKSILIGSDCDFRYQKTAGGWKIELMTVEENWASGKDVNGYFLSNETWYALDTSMDEGTEDRDIKDEESEGLVHSDVRAVVQLFVKQELFFRGS
ncbi:hypothetical protein GGI35DRAFT_202074 [Trichoderma velutinum]